MRSLLVTVSDFYQSKVITHFVCYSVKNRGKSPIFLTIFFKMVGGVRKNVICFLILRLPDSPKNIPVFWKLFLQHLKTESITCQEGRYEARRTIRFEWYFYVIGGRTYYLTSHLFWVNPHPQALRSVSSSSLSFLSPPLFHRSTAFPSGCRFAFRLH